MRHYNHINLVKRAKNLDSFPIGVLSMDEFYVQKGILNLTRENVIRNC
ncbi:hypothetical protein AQ16_5623 (plasmid) [Bacillus cereus G9241]|nr:hypothetical protein AQ16_5623 [Bacillus cereus G9241]